MLHKNQYSTIKVATPINAKGSDLAKTTYKNVGRYSETPPIPGLKENSGAFEMILLNKSEKLNDKLCI